MLKYTFHQDKSSFFKTLKQRVDAYFIEGKLDRNGGWRLLSKSIIQVLSACGLYTLLVFFTPPALVSVVLCLLLGTNLAVLGFNVMHEGGHQTFSRSSWLNTTSAYFLNILGGNAYYWKIKHNINHHTYTNIEGMDSDIDVKPFMRLHGGQPRHPYHRLQHVYWVFLYGISYLVWVFYDDFLKYLSGKISPNSERKSINQKEHFIFWFSKVMYGIVYIVIPILAVGWFYWLVGFLIVSFVCGLFTSIVFQLAHVVEGSQFHSAELQDEEKQEWAIHQIASTSNFGTSSRLLHWLLGGLNFQIEHHLFPRISHIHYPDINRFVREMCNEYDIAYHEFATMWRAIKSHLGYLQSLGSV